MKLLHSTSLSKEDTNSKITVAKTFLLILLDVDDHSKGFLSDVIF